MTGWTLDYLLDEISLDQIVMFYEYGYDFEEAKSIILINKLIEAITGKKPRSKKSKSKRRTMSDKPDLAKFEKLYGKIIKRPKK